MIGLTVRQREVLDFIATYIDAHRCSPSFNEIMTGTGLKSRSNVHRYVHRLVERGYLAPVPKHCHRGVIPLEVSRETL